MGDAVKITLRVEQNEVTRGLVVSRGNARGRRQHERLLAHLYPVNRVAVQGNAQFRARQSQPVGVIEINDFLCRLKITLNSLPDRLSHHTGSRFSAMFASVYNM